MVPQDGFQVHLVRFRAETLTPLYLPRASGAALRGALFGALRRQFCLAQSDAACGSAALAGACPVCFLLAPVDEHDPHGRDVPRPYVLRAPAGDALSYGPGQTFELSLATFGCAISHLPYALLGVQEVGERGLGIQRRGTFRLQEVWAENPLLGRQEALYQRARGATVHAPGLPIDGAQVATEAERLAAQGADRALCLDLVTPARLIEHGQLVKPSALRFRTLLARLLERVTALQARYGGPDTSLPREGVGALLRQAEEVAIAQRQVTWQELFRPSGRHGRMLPMGGLVGRFTITGDLRPFLPWLVWGSFLHVGKDASMGNGQLRLEVPAS